MWLPHVYNCADPHQVNIELKKKQLVRHLFNKAIRMVLPKE